MKKYWHVMKIGVANMLVYRFNFFFRAAVSLVPLLATIYLWQTIYRGQKPDVAGYSLGAMISYYLLVTIVDTLTAVNEDDWQIAADIKDGNISQFLLKPIDYLWYRLCLFLSGRVTYLAVAVIPLTLFILYLHQYFVLPPNWTAFGCFLLSTVLTALLQFFTSYAMAMLAFWLLEISTLIFILFSFEYIASGHMFPLDMLPSALEHSGLSPAFAQAFYHALMLTPFPYQMYFPVALYMGKISGADLWSGLLAQFLWVVIAYALARFMWRRGIKKYSAFGG